MSFPSTTLKGPVSSHLCFRRSRRPWSDQPYRSNGERPVDAYGTRARKVTTHPSPPKHPPKHLIKSLHLSSKELSLLYSLCSWLIRLDAKLVLWSVGVSSGMPTWEKSWAWALIRFDMVKDQRGKLQKKQYNNHIPQHCTDILQSSSPGALKCHSVKRGQ